MKPIQLDYPQNRSLAAIILVLIVAAVTAPAIAGAAATNPHWRKGNCDTCHQATQPNADQHALKTSTAEEVCGECHGKKDYPVCRHRSDIAVDAGFAEDFSDPFKAGLADGKVVCTTCHDMTPHCALDIKQRYRNASFLRGGPFDKDNDQCFGCHSKSGYRQKSPHMHVSGGQIKENYCMFCHGSVPQRDASGQWLPAQFAIDGPVSQLCSGCHAIGPHPSGSVTGKTGWMHMVIPPPDYAERMNQSVAERGGSLPLDPNTGEITCATCHNPHNRRLEGYPDAGEKTSSKLRYENICEVCHDK